MGRNKLKWKKRECFFFFSHPVKTRNHFFIFFFYKHKFVTLLGQSHLCCGRYNGLERISRHFVHMNVNWFLHQTHTHTHAHDYYLSNLFNHFDGNGFVILYSLPETCINNLNHCRQKVYIISVKLINWSDFFCLPLNLSEIKG